MVRSFGNEQKAETGPDGGKFSLEMSDKGGWRGIWGDFHPSGRLEMNLQKHSF